MIVVRRHGEDVNLIGSANPKHLARTESEKNNLTIDQQWLQFWQYPSTFCCDVSEIWSHIFVTPGKITTFDTLLFIIFWANGIFIYSRIVEISIANSGRFHMEERDNAYLYVSVSTRRARFYHRYQVAFRNRPTVLSNFDPKFAISDGDVASFPRAVINKLPEVCQRYWHVIYSIVLNLGPNRL